MTVVHQLNIINEQHSGQSMALSVSEVPYTDALDFFPIKEARLGLEVLEVVVDEDAFCISHLRPPVPVQRKRLPRTSASDRPG